MIHSTALVAPHISVPRSTYIGPYCVIEGNTFIGENCHIGPHVSIGQWAEHSSDKYELNPVYRSPGKIVIGDRIVIREFTTVNSPMKDLTFIGDDCYVMARCHISHDCYLEPYAILSTNVCLGGWTRIMRAANVGLGVITHQFTTVGAYSMTAMNSTIVKDIPPLAKYIPGKPLGQNTYSFKKWNLPSGDDSFISGLEAEWEKCRRPNRRSY